VHATTDARSRLQDDHPQPAPRERAGRGEARDPGAEDDDVDGGPQRRLTRAARACAIT
jgi:hypothetical protein